MLPSQPIAESPGDDVFCVLRERLTMNFSDAVNRSVRVLENCGSHAVFYFMPLARFLGARGNWISIGSNVQESYVISSLNDKYPT